MNRYEQLLEQAFQEAKLTSGASRAAWTDAPETRSLVAYLRAEEERIKEEWANGGYTTEEAYGTVQKNAEALGIITGVMNALTFIEELKAGEVVDND